MTHHWKWALDPVQTPPCVALEGLRTLLLSHLPGAPRASWPQVPSRDSLALGLPCSEAAAPGTGAL